MCESHKSSADTKRLWHDVEIDTKSVDILGTLKVDKGEGKITVRGPLGDNDLERLTDFVSDISDEATAIWVNPIELSEESWIDLKSLAESSNITFHYMDDSGEEMDETRVSAIKEGKQLREDPDE